MLDILMDEILYGYIKQIYTETVKRGTLMNALKSIIIYVLLFSIGLCTVCIYVVPACVSDWIMNTLACIILAIGIVQTARKYLNS